MPRKKIIHQGWNHKRVLYTHGSGALERALADAWEEEQAKLAHRRRGCLLQQLMTVPSETPSDIFGREKLAKLMTQDDARVAAEVIQWLGTNCGVNFLQNAVKRAGWKLTEPPFEPIGMHKVAYSITETEAAIITRFKRTYHIHTLKELRATLPEFCPFAIKRAIDRMTRKLFWFEYVKRPDKKNWIVPTKRGQQVIEAHLQPGKLVKTFTVEVFQ